MNWKMQGAPERKYHQPEAGLTVTDGATVAGYASLFGRVDQGNDVVQRGAWWQGRRLLRCAAGRG